MNSNSLQTMTQDVEWGEWVTPYGAKDVEWGEWGGNGSLLITQKSPISRS